MRSTRLDSAPRRSADAAWHPPASIYLLWYAFVFSLAFTDLVFLPRVFRDSLQLSTVLLAVLVVSLFIWALRTKSRLPRPDLASGLLYAFLLVAALSVFESVWSPLQQYRGERLWEKGIRQVLALAICVATYVVTIAIVRSRAEVRRTLTVYVATLAPALFAAVLDLLNYYAPSAVVSVLDHAIHRNVLVAPIQIQDVVVPRLQLLAFEPSMAANYLLSVVPVAFGLLLVRGGWRMRMGALTCGVAGVLMLIGTFSVGGFLAAWIELLSFVVFAPFILPWRRIIPITIAATAVLGFASLLPTQPAPVPSTAPQPGASANASATPSTESGEPAGRFVTTVTHPGDSAQDVSSSWRLITLTTAWNTFRDHPWTGVGWGNSVFYVLQEFPASGWQHPYAQEWTAPDGDTAATTAANNLLVRILAETGVVGGLVFILWHFGVLARALTAVRAREPLALCVLVAWAGIVAHYAALSGLDKRYWFFLPAMIVAISLLRRQEEKDDRMPITAISRVAGASTSAAE